MASITRERVIKVYDDTIGDHIYVGPDADALDLVELRYVDNNGKIIDRITGNKEMMLAVAESIIELYGNK
jgi:hypothetical protein